MKKNLFIFIAMFMGSYIAFSQEYTVGTVESVGGVENRNITVNGLNSIYSETGNFTLSADGAGSLASTYNLRVNKPNAGSTVHRAFLLGAPVWGSSGNCSSLNGTGIVWDGSATAAWGCCNYYDDVTAIVAAVIDPAGAGITNIPVTECNNMDGYALLVVFDDPLASQKTVVIMFGGLSTTGDNFSLTLSEAIDPNAAGALLDMGLGISFSAYGPCNGQRSEIDINGVRLTSSANGEDDGSTADGALMTVGGIGDLNTNPPDPYSWSSCDNRYDDELYSLLPLIDNTVTNILVNTVNPSNNDNIFLAYFAISGAAIIGEGILLSQTADTNFVGTNHTVNASVQDVTGAPVVGTLVDFTVLSGPNAGATYSEVTDVNGDAFFTYPGTGGVGTDEIQACFTNSQQVYVCSNILEKVWITGGPNVPLSNWALVLGIMMIVAFAVIRFRK